jgi:hypothetical protein
LTDSDDATKILGELVGYIGKGGAGAKYADPKNMNSDEKEIEIDDLRHVVAKALLPLKARKKGGRKGFGATQDPNVGAATQFKPGHSRPGPGRPRITPMAEALRERLRSRLPEKYAKTLGVPKRSTWADAVAWTVLYDLVKNPDAKKFEKCAQLTEGR